ncbi:MAG TPA: DUF2281 domain-containing protein [Candidatus Cloacimonetes bacterium]|nr:DUF2281 domain-containing protein [Candidatus Cloacimonadota bacterium]
MNHERTLEVKINRLPEDLKREVSDFIDFIIQKYQKKDKTKNKIEFNWEGGLEDLKEQFTSVELQHQAMKLR